MKLTYPILILFLFFLGISPMKAMDDCAPQVTIGGIINSYGAVSNITAGTGCSSIITVDDASGFMVGDQVLVIQMQGATINETNTSNFGNITNLNSAGLFEKVEIAAINGNQITTVYALLNGYQVSGAVQMVTIPQYVDAEVTTELTAMPWNGSKGGIIAMNVTGTLTLMANINASEAGFRGGTTSNSSSDCVALINITGHHYPLGSWESEQKGEGIAAYITGKEAGRGAQANGGGGGNDHNSGGGGGAGYGQGGNGGENLDPGFFNCHGNSPGIGGKAISFNGTRLFFGGGGGAGHENNNQSGPGGFGGGIIHLTAATLVTNGNFIKANGENKDLNGGLDGGSGGGGGGSILADLGATLDNLTFEAKGGTGADIKSNGQERCMGPGGGGGGGIVYSNATMVLITASVQGGQPGVVDNSIASCNGSSNNATAGANGNVLDIIDTPFNPGITSGEESYTGCQGDGYTVMVNGTSYNEASPSGTETLVNQYGCDSIVTINLAFNTLGISTVDDLLCSEESYVYNGVEYNINNPTGQEILSGMAYNGCDSVVNIDLSFSPAMTLSESTVGDEVTINVTGGTAPFSYDWGNGITGVTNTLTSTGNYTVIVTDAVGCATDFTFFFALTSNEEIQLEYGLDIFPNPATDLVFIKRDSNSSDWQVNVLNMAGQQLSTDNWLNGHQKSLDISNLSAGIYLLNIQSDAFSYTKKIVKK